MSKTLKIIIITILSAILFALLAWALNTLLLPLLPIQWQNSLYTYGAALITTVAVVSGMVQISGFSLKDLVLPDKTSNKTQDQQTIINMNADQINWSGDIRQLGSEKTLLLNSPPDSRSSDNVEKLIREIQSSLYDDNSKLPYVLTLCKDLCDMVGLTTKYKSWLMVELTGNLDSIQSKYSKDDFTQWMNEWGTHRVIESYFKARYRSQETGEYNIDDLSLGKFIVPFSVAEISRTIMGAKQNKQQELYQLLRDVSPERFAEVKAQNFGFSVQTPNDLRMFIKVSDYEKILDDVRAMVLKLLEDVRRNN